MADKLDTLRYRVYVTDALKAIAENTSRSVPSGVTLTKRWADLLDNTTGEDEQPQDTRPAHEIAAEIWVRIRGDSA